MYVCKFWLKGLGLKKVIGDMSSTNVLSSFEDVSP